MRRIVQRRPEIPPTRTHVDSHDETDLVADPCADANSPLDIPVPRIEVATADLVE